MVKTLIKYELVINRALRSALMYDTAEQQINEFISFLGRQIGSDRIYIFEDNEKTRTTSNTYEWCADGVSTEMGNLKAIPMQTIRWWYDRFDEGKSVILHDAETIRQEHPHTYALLKAQNVHSLVVCPFRYNSEIRGFFGVDNPPESDFLGLTTFLDMIATVIISFYKIRNTQIRSARAARFSGYSALAKIYISMHYINVQTHSFHIIKASDSVQQMVGKIASLDSRYTAEEDFCAHADAVLHTFCREDHLEDQLKFVDLRTLEQRLQGQDSIVNVFYSKLSGWCRDRFIAVDYDAHGHLHHVLYCVECIEQQKEREDRLLNMARKDQMTGLYNRGSGEKLIETALQNKVSGLLCLIDCDKFKSINDTFGHAVGDAVIVAIAATLQNSCRSDDIVMRLGGDEFAIFVPTVTEKASAESFFARLFDNIKSIQIPELGPRPIIVSLGACLYDGKETANFDMLYRRADHAMYQSKKQPGFTATIYGEI